MKIVIRSRVGKNAVAYVIALFVCLSIPIILLFTMVGIALAPIMNTFNPDKLQRKVLLNIDNEKLSFIALLFWRNTLQTFVIGYVTMIGFALYLTDSNISMADFIHPLLWMPAMLIAPIIGTIRALK
ncbi:hypothetical protein [Shewanella sp. S23-S33]|uniref:hypothetical protein n=1 Tax=Shewanella sp. S23-S33 TaxID=3342769 RepID=UPI00372D264F